MILEKGLPNAYYLDINSLFNTNPANRGIHVNKTNKFILFRQVVRYILNNNMDFKNTSSESFINLDNLIATIPFSPTLSDCVSEFNDSNTDFLSQPPNQLLESLV